MDFCRNLIRNNFNIYATNGTFNYIKKFQIKAQRIEEYIRFPEIMDGRIKTLHPKIHGGILSRRRSEDKVITTNHGILLFDMVIVNFCPVLIGSNLQQSNELKNILDKVDIGGPAMVRSAAKNYDYVSVIVDIEDYKSIIEELNLSSNGKISVKKNLFLAIKAFRYSFNYELLILKKLECIEEKKNKNKKDLKESVNLILKKKIDLCYGENPNQKAAVYVQENSPFDLLNEFCRLKRKKLSYNNVYDLDLALECAFSFKKPACVIVKHGTPCGAATSDSALKSYLLAYKSDKVSAFGSVIAFNCLIDEKVAIEIVNRCFIEVIVASFITPSAKHIFSKKNSIRLLTYNFEKMKQDFFEFRSINGGFLVQEKSHFSKLNNWSIVTRKKPSIKEIEDAIFAWKVVKFIKSNAVVYVYNSAIISVGSGQTSRVDAVKIANEKAKNKKYNFLVMASDAFFPFKDSVKLSKLSNVTCIIQPGGSIRDAEVINEANKQNMSMIFTSSRIFKH